MTVCTQQIDLNFSEIVKTLVISDYFHPQKRPEMKIKEKLMHSFDHISNIISLCMLDLKPVALFVCSVQAVLS